VEGAAGNVVNMPGPQDVRLDMLFEEVRLATASALGDAAELAQSAADMAATVAERAQVLLAPQCPRTAMDRRDRRRRDPPTPPAAQLLRR
jgi:hypothetical protein